MADDLGDHFRRPSFLPERRRERMPEVVPRAPKPLFKPKGLVPRGRNESLSWDASPDGKKFIVAVSPSTTGAAPLIRFVVVLNWQAALKK